MVEWVSFGLNVVVPILIGLVVMLSLALYAGIREIKERVPTKEEMMDMGFTVINAVVEEKAEQLGITELLKSPPPGQPSTASGAGRPGEGLLGKLMWFAENTEIGRALASRFLNGGIGGGGGGGGSPQDYYK